MPSRPDDADRLLVAEAMAAREAAYAPVSRFRVGAALRCVDGTVVRGCNVEHVVLPETVCAEKVALVKAVSDRRTRFDAIAVITDHEPAATPCGSCRQMLHAWRVPRVVVANTQGDVSVWRLDELLPGAFDLELP